MTKETGVESLVTEGEIRQYLDMAIEEINKTKQNTANYK
jgi:hypothetical protein